MVINVICMSSYFIYMYSYAIRISVVCTRMSSVCHSYVISTLLTCTRMSSVYHSYVLVCHPWSVCHSHVFVCHPYVTPMYSYVIRMSLVGARMSLVGGLTMNHSCSKKFVLETETKSLKNTFKEIHILVKFQAPCVQLYNNQLLQEFSRTLRAFS